MYPCRRPESTFEWQARHQTKTEHVPAVVASPSYPFAPAYASPTGPSRRAGERRITAEDAASRLATLLGLTPTGFIGYTDDCVDATDKLRNLWTALMPSEAEDPTDPIIRAFCAKFLPSLPSVEGPYHRMLLAVLQSNYFAKYMRSPLGSELYPFFVNQVINGVSHHLSPCIQNKHHSRIITVDAHEYKSQIRPLSDDTLAQLKNWLRIKAEESLEIIRPESQPNRIQSVLNILEGRIKSEVLQLTLTRRETFDRYAESHKNGKTLTRLECARCQTVAYCCRAHQKHDWGSRPQIAMFQTELLSHGSIAQNKKRNTRSSRMNDQGHSHVLTISLSGNAANVASQAGENKLQTLLTYEGGRAWY
ncbi:hypothetical protein B0H14DRAFT_2567423 [Mycena olivaceomarginata]|nr:hypothetical protein B0H14DRAFT_2567423 [Mycena olivaceomarginata]